jgi:hypothetical protein
VLAVRPDAVGGAVTIVWGQLIGAYGVPQAVNVADSVFVEVKAIRGALTLSHSSHQITGFIDIAANSPAALMPGPERPTPAIVFMTAGSTVIASTVLEAATQQRVAIWQTLVFELSGSTTANPRFGFGPVVPLNPEVYGPSWPQPIPPGPTNIPFPLPPAFRPPPAFDDPDPPEVQ